LLALVFAALPGALRAQTGAPSISGDERIESTDISSIQTPETVIENWPDASRLIARAMIEKYGEPERFDESALTWDDNGAWKRSVVYRKAAPHFFTMTDKDYLEQTIGYRVPAGKIEDLKRFDKRISVDETGGELSARSDSEPMNYLALNLAEEVITDERSVDNAREFYLKTEELYKSGKVSPYLSGFVFAADLNPDYTPPEIR
jgi:hypothetical protein